MNSIPKRKPVFIGIILGIVLALVLLICYAINITLLTNVWIGLLNIFLIVVFGILSIIVTKRVLGGFISFREAFTSYFITSIIGNLIMCSFLVLFFNGIMSQEHKDNYKNELVEFGIKQAKASGIEQEKIDEAIEKAKLYDPFAPAEIMKPMIKYLMRDILIGLLVALAFRNKNSYPAITKPQTEKS